MNRVSAYNLGLGGYAPVQRRAFTKVDMLRARTLYKTLVLGVFTLVMALFCIWTRTQVVHIGYQINALRTQQNEYKTVNRQLQMELSLLKSPKRLGDIASKQLNMRTPTQTQIVRVK